MKPIKKLLVANRSEIAIRVFRSATELGIRTVAVYAYEDRYALHRFKADEAYQIGVPGEPIKSYLNIPALMQICRDHGVDAIHPGYGFMSENPDLAKACLENGIQFVGPTLETLQQLGDKTSARKIAKAADVPVLGGTDDAIADVSAGRKHANTLGYPIILKAAHGGGGRGMRVVRTEDEFDSAFEQATREALSAFGNGDVFVEKFIENARHIEVQLLGDTHGNLVHLWERDCSVQRRHQKVIEIAPAPNLKPEVRQALCDAAISIGKQVSYQNAGTVEFLVDADTDQFFFIEVNPRIQVEHTVTEEVTGVDIVKSQIMVAQGDGTRSRRYRARRSGFDQNERLCHAMPYYDRRSRQQLHARLRSRNALSFGGRSRRASRCRFGIFGSGRQSVLRLDAGETVCPRSAIFGRHSTVKTLFDGVPHSWRENEHSVPVAGTRSSHVHQWEMHHSIYRQDTRPL